MNDWNDFTGLNFFSAAQKTWNAMEKQVLASQCRLLQAYLANNDLITKIPHDVQREELTISGRKAEILAEKNLATQKHILYIHGGGFALGSLDSHRELVGCLAKHSKTKVLSIDYRLAPDNPYPAGLEDVYAAWEYLNKISEPNKLAIAGDSAGGGLAVALVQKLAKENKPLPKVMYLLSPWLDLTLSGDSFDYNAGTDPILQKKPMQQMAEIYANGRKLDDPLLSPLFGDFSAMPPTIIQVSQHEALLEDARRFNAHMLREGVEVELEEIAWQPHVWQLMCGYWPQSDLALRRAGFFINNKLST